MPNEPRRELSSTYFVQDRSSTEEMNRLHLQDVMITKAMGGVLPEQGDPTQLRRVVDVGCGTGGWLIELAKAYPTIELLVGADISIHIVEYAREQARRAGVDDRVEFQVMDALRMIEFPKHHFDLLNQRFGFSYLRTWDWPNLLTKYLYTAKPGGIIRITEGCIFDTSTSTALTEFYQLAFDAMFRAGHLFRNDPQSIPEGVPQMLRNHGLNTVQIREIPIEYHHGTPMMESFIEDTRLISRVFVPFLRKWGKVPDHYDDLCQQALNDLQDPECVTTGKMVTIWGTTP